MQIAAENILNVTLLESKQKHPSIFARFDELAAGESLTIHNDHDPKPLYYQLLSERGNIFEWEYLEQGPEWWKVKMTKRFSGEQDETMGAMVVKDLRKAEVFKKYGLDFCCGGKKTVKQACAEMGLDSTKIEQELQLADKVPTSSSLPYDDWSLDFLTDYIVNTHHSYVTKNLPAIKTCAEKVMKVHGDHHPELLLIHQLVEEVNAELLAHMVKEERVLFPYIKGLVAAKNNTQPLQAAHFGTVQNPINMMEMEHELVGENLAKIRELTHNYILPEEACASYSLLYSMLEAFEKDLHVHIHLENNILHPKALALEKKLNN
jgi:regulator of cell morphogenesis and NO signaling